LQLGPVVDKQSLGFEIVDEVQLPPDEPSMWTLWREAREERDARGSNAKLRSRPLKERR